MKIYKFRLTHWGRLTHICIGKLNIIASDNGLSPGRRQAITWTNAGILLIGPLGTNFSEILIEISTFSFKKMHLKVSSVKWRPFCLGLNVLRIHWGRFPRVQLTKFMVLIMACRLAGAKPIVVSLLTHISDTRPQWVKAFGKTIVGFQCVYMVHLFVFIAILSCRIDEPCRHTLY